MPSRPTRPSGSSGLRPTLRAVLSALQGPVPLSREQAMGATERLAATTSLLSSVEHLARRREHRSSRMNEWAISRDAYARYNRPFRKLLDLASDERTHRALHAGRVAASAALILPGNGRWRGAATLYLGVSGALLYPGERYGTDGSDQASTMVQTVTGLARLAPSSRTQDALIWYVALQGNLSYLVSGWVKLLGPDWRSGAALAGVMRTRTYGHEGVWKLAHRHPRTTRALVYGVLGLECLFPVLYLRGGRLTRPVLGGAVLFHLANGYVMGLGRFLPAFAAMHPMVAYTSTPRSHPAAAGRDDTMPAAVALLAAGGAAVLGTVAAARRLRVTDTPHGGTAVTTRHGNELSVQGTLDGRSTDPVVVFVHGLGACPAYFAWIARAFGADRPWLMYNRAGYGPSRRRAEGEFTLEESVDDLVDLVEAAVPEGRQVALMGHSLGGEISRRAAVRLGSRVNSVVYVDSSHPGQLTRSAQQGATAPRIGEGLRTMAISLRLGFGSLMRTPDPVANLPEQVRDKVRMEFADSRVWTAAVREWKAVEQDFPSFTGPLDALDTHALVLSAQRTVDRDPDHLLMHKDLADAHHGDRTVRSAVIEGADHDGILTDPQYAAATLRHLLAFLADTAAREPEARPGLPTGTEPSGLTAASEENR
ncbi:alpha/beta fold hydrolase [Streptomyces sp. S8]|uniref:alpha/beta fold hydrolase n=1 Tax=Streptomyces sp. S8 TaxID=1837283 RepID=UPI0023B18592|nr:alpha/beta fold hydrolase [Streptomyces sp. S8]